MLPPLPSSSSLSRFQSQTDEADNLLRRCTELSFILHHALRLDPSGGGQNHELEYTIAASLSSEPSPLSPQDSGSADALVDELELDNTAALLGALDASFSYTLSLTAGFRPPCCIDGDETSSLPATAQDVQDQQSLNQKRRTECLGLQTEITEKQDTLQHSLATLTTSLIQILTTYPPLLASYHLKTTIPSQLSQLSTLLLKFSLLPYRSRASLSRAHPDLDASLANLGEALERRIIRAHKEKAASESELARYKKAFGGERQSRRFEGLMKEMEAVRRETNQVERDIKRLGGGVGGRA